MSEEQGGTASFRVTFKGQGQSDPWLTVEGNTSGELNMRLEAYLGLELDEVGEFSTAELIAKAAAHHVAALNAQPGISTQRDNKASNTANAAAASTNLGSLSPSANRARPALSTSLKTEADGNYWINLPYVKSAAQRDKIKKFAKDLGARYKPEEAIEAGVPLNSKGTGPERPWCVHLSYMDEESVAAILQAVETDFKDI